MAPAIRLYYSALPHNGYVLHVASGEATKVHCNLPSSIGAHISEVVYIWSFDLYFDNDSFLVIGAEKRFCIDSPRDKKNLKAYPKIFLTLFGRTR